MTDLPPPELAHVSDEALQAAVAERGLTPKTRRFGLAILAAVALVAIVAEVLLLMTDHTSSDALLTLAATAVGGIAGVLRPQGD